MKIILLKDVKGVGRRFEEKNVSDGHAMNLLIPKKLAVAVSGSTAGQIKALKEQEEKSRKEKAGAISENVEKLRDLTLSVKVNANDQGHLFASLTKEKISKLLKEEKGIALDPEYITLASAIKETGTFEVPVEVEGGERAKFTLEVLSS